MMDSSDLMMATPLWVVFLLTMTICMGSVEVGTAITARWLKPRFDKEPDGPVGYQVSVSGLRRLRGTPVLAGAFSLVIFIIADIDRPGEGFIRVSPQPLCDVLESMRNDSP